MHVALAAGSRGPAGQLTAGTALPVDGGVKVVPTDSPVRVRFPVLVATNE